ncbi:hypothetical protein MHU86_19709 [Fragilaria crotonensis]|nr:hypothetical protein MHU86_19709 [Fragilaria crotonensis]
MCCRWHLNGKCVRSCFLSASHVALTTEQTASVRAWIEQCRARMRMTLVRLDAAQQENEIRTLCICLHYNFFVAQPSRWSFDHEAAHREFHNRRTTGDAPPFRDSRQPTDGPIAGPSIAIPLHNHARRQRSPRMRHRSRPRHRLAPPDRPRPSAAELTAPALRTRTFVSRHDSWTPSGVLGPTVSHSPWFHFRRYRFRMSTRLSRAFPNLDSPMLWPASSTPPADDAPDRIPLRMDSRGGRSQPGSPPALRAGPQGSRGRPTVQRGDTRIRISIRRAPGAAPLRTPALVALPRAHFRRRGFSLREISDADRLADVRDNLARGNHKSARGHEAKLISMLKKKWKGAGNCPYRGRPLWN